MANAVNTKGRPATFATKKAVVAALADVNTLSRFLKLQLVEAGYLAVQKVEKETRGRPAHNYVLTGKAKGLLNLAKNWK